MEKFSDSSVYWNPSGVAYFRTGNFESAVTALDHAAVLGCGGTSFDHVFLAMSHARLGNREESQRYLDKVKFEKEKSHPGYPELARFCDEAQSIIASGQDASTVTTSM